MAQPETRPNPAGFSCPMQAERDLWEARKTVKTEGLKKLEAA